MSLFITAAVIAALMGSALIGGVFFAFSNFIMKALARVPSHEGIAAMQSINVVVLNPLFLGIFTGTAAICALIAGVAVIGWGTPSAPWYVAGATAYIAGTFLLTGLGNVPLNNELASVTAAGPTANEVWQKYLDRWTRLNTIRTVASFAAALMLVTGLLQNAAA